jgi:hypothetical protein
VELLVESLEGVDSSHTHQRLAMIKRALFASQQDTSTSTSPSSPTQTAPTSSPLPESATQSTAYQGSVEGDSITVEPHPIQQSGLTAGTSQPLDSNDMEFEAHYEGDNIYNGENSSQESGDAISFGKLEVIAW